MSAARLDARDRSPGLYEGSSTGWVACCSRARSNALSLGVSGASQATSARRDVLVYVVEHHEVPNVFIPVQLAAREPACTLALRRRVVGLHGGDSEEGGDVLGVVHGMRWGERGSATSGVWAYMSSPTQDLSESE